MSTGFPLSRRDSAYQPRATPWGWYVRYGSVLKERRISSTVAGIATACGVPLERGNRRDQIPGALPRAGMRGSFGAGIACAAETQKLEALKPHKRGLMQQLFPSPEEAS